ncbi:MAG: TolC family protein [Cyclobacteriaceae bacterium]|nr:MAG: TolC family protein [Cyclobacteriaceae bacterium]
MYKTLGFNLSIPIFNGYTTRSSIRRSSIQYRLAQITAQETEQTLRQSVESAYNDALSSSKTYNASLRQVQAREEAYRMMDQRLKAGSANSFEVQVSQNSLFQAQTDLARAKYDFIFKKKVLDFYQGKKLGY